MKVLVGLSGGVDSSVAALILQQQFGASEVAGMFMKNWEEDDTSVVCPAELDAAVARQVAETLAMRFYARNFATEYWDGVFEYFLAELRAGRTPNPDVLCNREVKFKTFLEHARALGAEFIATGHYARKDQRDGLFRLLRGRDSNKDQSYFLHALDQSQLAPALFPIGELEKPLVRKLAEQAGLPTYARKDSTGICFIGERNYTPFIQRYLRPNPGPMQTPLGVTIGLHNGLHCYTLGQRGGLHLGGVKGGSGAPWYVVGKDFASNTLIVNEGEHPALYSAKLRTSGAHWIAGVTPELPLLCTAKTRYRQPDQACRVEAMPDGGLEVTFERSQRAVTPGQFVVFYQDEVCLGGASISQSNAVYGGWQ